MSRASFDHLVSPTSGAPLRADGPDILTDGHERWPVLDGIPYLRIGRAELVREILACLDRGDRDGALIAALADQDDWWDGPAPDGADLRHLVEGADRLSLREAMTCLAFGRVGDYFAHRWSDPTFVAGVELIDAHWAQPSSAFELACGIGHYLRELAGRGVAVAGGDVVFAKLWLARRWVVPSASLVCFDAAGIWPVRGHRADLVLCHDALYFLEPKAHVIDGLRSLVRTGGTLLVGHVHNSGSVNHSAGAGMSAAEIAAMFPGACVYDDAALTRSGADGTAPMPQPAERLVDVEAFSLAEGAGRTGHRPAPAAGERMCLNPLYGSVPGGREVRWPSDRYGAEYGPLATFRTRIEGVPQLDAGAIRRREFVDLPDRW